MKWTEHTSAFLLELILDLLIFTLCTAVCVGIFVQARSMSRQSSRLTDAVYLAQSAAENLRSGSLTVPQQDGYALDTQEETRGGVTYFTITVFGDGKEVYTLEGAYPAEVVP